MLEHNTKLPAALNGFIEKQYRGLIHNTLDKKYFKNRGSIRKLAKGREKAMHEDASRLGTTS